MKARIHGVKDKARKRKDFRTRALTGLRRLLGLLLLLDALVGLQLVEQVLFLDLDSVHFAELGRRRHGGIFFTPSEMTPLDFLTSAFFEEIAFLLILPKAIIWNEDIQNC